MFKPRETKEPRPRGGDAAGFDAGGEARPPIFVRMIF